MVTTLILMYFGGLRLGHIKQIYNTSDCRSRDTLNFDFSEKGLDLAPLPHFVYYFSRKTFIMLHSTN